MKRTLGLILLMICVAAVYSQTTLSFCASVESSGYCNFDNTKFITSPDSTKGRIFMEVKSIGTPIGATSLIFKIYKLNSAGEAKFSNMLQQAIQADWFFAWSPYIFDSPGKFEVKVFNESDQQICSRGFELIAFK